MLRKHKFLSIPLGFILCVIIANFSPDKFLLGWDNLPVEFNFGLNIQRSVFSAWQTYQGLGVVAGNGHAADLPRQLILLLISFIPLNLIRQFYVFLMLGLGTIGVYFLLRKIISFEKKTFNEFIPVLGSLFYLFNLATLQNFYVPFEPFVAHFAALPWLFLVTINLLTNSSKKTLWLFVIVNFLAIPQGQVPTVFFVYLCALFLFLLVFNLITRNKALLKKSVLIIILTLAINSFWLLPFIYFFTVNSHVAFDAKINQMATETVFLQNKEFGSITDAILLKGFWFNNVDLYFKNSFDYMLISWREYLTLPVSSIGYLFFSIILLGLTFLKRRMPFVLSFFVLFLLSFTMIVTSTPPFSLFNELLRKIPLFNEVFRFPFTKFSTLASLSYAIFFGLGTGRLMEIIIKFKFLKRIKPTFAFCTFLILFIILMLPIFQGNLFYKKTKVAIPQEYFSLFNYLKKQNQTLRIANFPQYTFWGWNYYNWGYGGSGFLWYAIKQPILDRAFDVWSGYNENYYWEISHALYSQNAKLFENVLNKYHISFILLDENIINPVSPSALFSDGLKQLTGEVSSIHLDKTFGKLTLYRVNLKNQANELKNIVKVNPYSWNDNDYAYSQFGNYISTNKDDNYFYPFRSLFSGKNEENQEFHAKVYSDRIEFSNPLPSFSNSRLLVSEIQNFISAEFFVKHDPDRSIIISSNMQTPEIFIHLNNEKKKIWGEKLNKIIFQIQNPSFPLVLNINGIDDLMIAQDQTGSIGKVLLLKDQGNMVSLRDNNSKLLKRYEISNKDILALASSLPKIISLGTISEKSSLIVSFPRMENEEQKTRFSPSGSWEKYVKNCEAFKKGQVSGEIISLNEEDFFELTSKNATACMSFDFPSLDHNQGYVALVKNANLTGRTIHFWILDGDRNISIIDNYIKKSENPKTSVFVVPPEGRYAMGYSLHFDGQSIGDNETKNLLGSFSLLPIPYEFLSSLRISNLNPKKDDNAIATNYQSFNPGWKAYKIQDSKNGIANRLNNIFPFLFGKELKNHVLVNNWANGWTLDDSKAKAQNTKIITVFWPQYLEYLGFVILIGTFAWLLIARRKTK